VAFNIVDNRAATVDMYTCLNHSS